MLNLSIVSNILIEHHVRNVLSYSGDNNLFFSNIHYIPFDNIYNEDQNLDNSNIIVFLVNFNVLYPDAANDIKKHTGIIQSIESGLYNRCYDAFAHIKNKYNSQVIWFGFEDYYLEYDNVLGNTYMLNGLIESVNQKIYSVVQRTDVFVDLKRLIAKEGIGKALDKKGFYRWNAPYSKELIELMVEEVYKQHLIATGNTKKCLVLDCDNVLWGGTLTEDGIAGIQVSTSGVGRSFQDFQRYLLNLYYHGVILVVCSKNDEPDVLNVFREHTGMLLKEEHIACFRCNWNNKPENIRYISESLNIGLDSIVFVDDSVFEIESVKTMLPDVTAVLYQRDTIYEGLSCFNLKRDVNIQTVKERTNTYKTNFLRSELQKNAPSYEDYVASLEMVVDIHATKYHELSRISELTQRTNKCTNGMRYTLDELKDRFSSDNYKLYTICLSDKFSDLGIVGAVGLQEDCVELFSLSCRALGRGVEDKTILMTKDMGVNKIKFEDTGKNAALLHLMKLNGFILSN